MPITNVSVDMALTFRVTIAKLELLNVMLQSGQISSLSRPDG